jgi:branched-chain amino acid transport system substrate-binding protein
LIQKILSGKPDAIVGYMGPPEMVQVITTARRAGFNGPIGDALTWGDPNTLALVPAEINTDNVYGIALVDTTGTAPGWASYSANVSKYAPGANPSAGFTCIGYVSAQVVAEGLRRAGDNLTPDGITKAMEQISAFDTGGITGPISFSATSHLGLSSAEVIGTSARKFAPVTQLIPIT